MLVLRTVGEGQIRYYLSGPELGRWAGAGCRLLGLEGPVDATALRAVLAGQQPDGTRLVRRAARRRAGFDLILAAPKSVSLLAALSDGDTSGRIRLAHDQAVWSVCTYLERWATWTRRSGEQIATHGLTAASFSHHWSAAGDPHLHTHMVIANLVHGDDGVWSTLDSRALYRHARAAGAIFQASLRHSLAQQSLRFDWAFRRNGLADIAGVPRSAIDACSRRQDQVTAEVTAGSAGRRGRATAAGRTRARPGASAAESWADRAGRAGFHRDAAAAVAAVAATGGRPAQPPPPAPAGTAVETVLAERHSSFERRHVIEAVAGLAVAGASGSQLERWADGFLANAVALDRGRWTTARLQAMERRIGVLASRSGPPPAGAARAATVEAVLAGRPSLTDTAQAALRRLTTRGAPVELLRAGSLVSQAWVLDAARAAWEASGHQVAVLSPTERGAARWQALAGIGPPPPAPAHPTVLIVDGADRCPTATLHRVLTDGEARNAKVVLVDGGTTPARRHPASPAMEDLRTRLPSIDCGRQAPDPSRLPVAGCVVRGGIDASVAVAADGPAAMAQLVADWADARAGPLRPTMVAMGPEEADYLNAAARLRLQAAGRLAGPAIEAGGRRYQAGDEVRALRRDGRLGSVPGGTVGVATAVDPARQQLVVRWPDGEVVLTGRQLAGAPLTHAYATTPAYLRGETSGPALALGDPGALAPGLTPVAIVQVMADTRTGASTDPLSRLLDELAPEPSGRAVPHAPGAAAFEPLAGLCRERDRLAQSLGVGAPPDRRPELRRVSEERAWLAAAGPGRGAPVSELRRRHGDLLVAADARAIWLRQHRGELLRWEELTVAIAWRTSALGQAAATRPTRAVLGELGPRPAGPAGQRAWSHAVRAVEAYRDRWSLPDGPLALGTGTGDPTRPSPQLAGALAVITGRRALEQARGPDRTLGPPGR